MINLDKYKKRKVVLVDKKDNELGVAELIEAHREKGLKHRALSLFLWREINCEKEWLLQKRAMVKPIFPGLWANTCCYNLAPGEEYLEVATKRVREELGIKIKEGELQIIGRFSYFAEDKDGWCENEVDTVIVGRMRGGVEIELNPDEVQDWKWVKEKELKEWMEKRSEDFAPWFKMVWKIVMRK